MSLNHAVILWTLQELFGLKHLINPVDIFMLFGFCTSRKMFRKVWKQWSADSLILRPSPFFYSLLIDKSLVLNNWLRLYLAIKECVLDRKLFFCLLKEGHFTPFQTLLFVSLNQSYTIGNSFSISQKQISIALKKSKEIPSHWFYFIHWREVCTYTNIVVQLRDSVGS